MQEKRLTDSVDIFKGCANVYKDKTRYSFSNNSVLGLTTFCNEVRRIGIPVL